ncbi:MAG: FecR domain-containing protein, partial [Pseudomonadota bacterium]
MFDPKTILRPLYEAKPISSIAERLRRLALSSAIALTAGLSAFSISASAAPEIGTSAGVRGEVFVTTSGAQRKAQVREAIRLQDEVLTKEDSALQILLLDRSTFTVGQNCRLTIDRFVYDPSTDSGQVSARVARGAFRFMSGRIGQQNPTNASVATPSATIGIRGTFFEGVVGEDAVALAQLGGHEDRIIGLADERTAGGIADIDDARRVERVTTPAGAAQNDEARRI